VKVTARSLALTPVAVIRRIIDFALAVAIVGFLVLFGLQFPHSSKLDMLWLTVRLHEYGDPAVTAIGAPFKWAWPPPADSRSLLPIGVALLTWVVKIAVDAVFLRSYRVLAKLLPAPQPLAVAAGGSGLPGLPGFEMDTAIADSERAREQLLKRYREIEKALQTSKRKLCTFLSVDVMGSTQMKVGERETEIAATFQAYEEMLRKIFDQYGAWKQAWTPDGVMICFLDRELAVGAAQRILQSLAKFNQRENKLRTPFRLRCGLNEGEVPIYEDSKLEKVADRVIDVAGHMQKQAAPDTLWLPVETYNALANKAGFQAVETVVDGYSVYEWKHLSAS
jgi:class 3 adenylate cyclase